MSFDITIAFDKAKYLDPQLYMFIDTLKDNMPEDTVLHVVTNRNKNDKVRKYIQDNVKCKVYHNPGNKTKHLKSRCKYMFNCFDIKTNKPWVIKMEADMLVLKHLSILENILDDKYDLIIEPENRKIFTDNTEKRLWRIIYKSMGIIPPLNSVMKFRENDEYGLPLVGTGMICVKSKHLPKINDRWIHLTERCEPWINMNTHPNEMAFTGLIYDEGWEYKQYRDIYKFNPIGHFRDGEFPSTSLVDNCKLPKDTVCFDYHRPEWLFHVAKFNDNIMDIIKRNVEYIPKEWWKLPIKDFQENV